MKKQIFTSILLISFFTQPKSEESTDLIKQIYNLKNDTYTGGISSKNRNLAKNIRLSMIEEFKEYTCEDPNLHEGILISEDEKSNFGIEQLGRIKNKNLRSLVKATFDENQEIRDMATYTLSLFGPSIKEVVPFLKTNRSNDLLKGNWYNHALSEIDCVNWTAADFRRVLPNNLLPDEEPWRDFLDKAPLIMIKLYENSDIEYPPEMLSHTFENYGFSDFEPKIVMGLYNLLNNQTISINKRSEAAMALQSFKLGISSFNGDSLVKFTRHKNIGFAEEVGNLLIHMRHPFGLKLIEKHLKTESWWGWQRDICAYGITAIELEGMLLKALDDYGSPSGKIDVMKSLGCIKSQNAIPLLLIYAEGNEWELAKHAVENIGNIGLNTRKIRKVLKRVVKKTWSSQVRDAAIHALAMLKGKVKSDLEEENMITIKMGPASVDHGLLECEEDNIYSIDGKNWFSADWHKESLPEPPQGFPQELISDYRTHDFFQVEDGWLFGSEKGHYDGSFIFWAKDIEPYYLTESYAAVYSIFEYKNDILAIGYQIFEDEDAGVLFKIEKINQKWVAKRVITLPSPPFGYAFGPNNELLLSDYLNSYALINNQIKPLSCKPKKK